MRYYDNDFRKKLKDILKTYRGILTQQIASLDEENKSNLPLIENQINQIDDALETIKPSLSDMLTKKKMEKLQEQYFYDAKVEEIRQKAKKDFEKEIRDNFTKEMEDKLRKQVEDNIRKEVRDSFTKEVENQLREELKPKILAELEKELNDKQNEDGVRKLANQIIGFVRRAFPERTETSPKTVASSEEIDAKDLDDDDYGTDPNPDDYDVE